MKPSYVPIGEASASTVEFANVFRRDSFPKIDVLVCPGDLGDRADPQAIDYAWKFLNDIKSHNPQCVLLATAGNHDIDSRGQHSDFDAKASLYGLEPSYPCNSGAACLAHKNDFDRQLWFWARNFYMYSMPDCRFIVLNSAAYHGAGTDQKEYNHGRVSEFTLRCIREAIDNDTRTRTKKKRGLPKLNVLVCHHHLLDDGKTNDPDYSAMRGANSLLEFVSDSNYGRWVILHGHRHRAKLFQTNGATGPYVLSSGSFGATRDGDYGNGSPNQVHLIDLDFEAMEKFHLFPAGRIRSWTWVPHLPGWQFKDAPTGGLPPETGFGYRGAIDKDAFKMSQIVAAAKSGVEWKRVLQEAPEWEFLDYRQLSELAKVLDSKFSIEIRRDQNGSPIYLIPRGEG